MTPVPLFLIVLVALVALEHVRRRRARLPKGTRWLPGPPGLPFIGRVWDIPRQHSYKKFKAWSDQYGPIYQMNIFGEHHVWLASDKIAKDLLVTRSGVYSDRPMIKNLEDNVNTFADVWRRQRRFVHQTMAKSTSMKHLNLPYIEAKKYLAELMDSPSDYQYLMEKYTGRVISRLAFGDVRHYAEVTTNSHALLGAISPAANLSNIIPQLRLLPMWLSPWKKSERARHDREREFFVRMYTLAKSDYDNGTLKESYMSQFFEGKEKSGADDIEGAYIIGMIGLAGILTTASAFMTYILAICLHPEWQEKVQKELDEVCGDRMPEPSDSPKLPVLRAVIKEIIRWRPVTPSSIPHETVEDDIYDGYFIPKGSQVHPNQWAITRETSVYPDPETFNPQRWLDPSFPSYQEPLTQYPSIKNFTTFGYGRRICMGMDLVEDELLVGIGGMAWACNIRKKRDENGREIPVSATDYSSLLISRPKQMDFDLTPRDTKRGQLVKFNYAKALETAEIIRDSSY
ncbi:cytochrome P450 [Mollisia scopiformis]|uniref:Cytochrome P450 n=1 Tax=Mollisia scopiformis TaxID=149040 RepID=A0A194XU44_MOLSC|nr:cytochrome P450 [Mollisia scopiformis]KUJ23227.1 cytochrome P450 [Mollisia scopiformis]